MRRSDCNGTGGGAGDGAAWGVRVTPCLRTATAQIVSVVRSHIARGHGHGHANGWAYLCAPRRSRRSGRSSEPGREAGTHPWDGQGNTQSSAPLTGSASATHNAVDENRPRRWLSLSGMIARSRCPLVQRRPPLREPSDNEHPLAHEASPGSFLTARRPGRRHALRQDSLCGSR